MLDATFGKRKFFLCGDCCLIMADAGSFPSPQEEKERYLQHHNSPQNEGYIKFLSQLTGPLEQLLADQKTCLDYGCGPSPVLAGMLRSKGLDCSLYDPFFFPDMPDGKFDFVVSTECPEHFFDPAADFGVMADKIKDCGYLAIMTETWETVEKFSSWHYIRDKTHVAFYHIRTMEWISAHYRLTPVYSDGKRVFIWQKPGQ